jgi:uncharacterized protein YdiU (UPF0061 family)
MGILRNKLGLTKNSNEDQELIRQLLNIMHENQLDWNNTFLTLTQRLSAVSFSKKIPDQLQPSLEVWISQWLKRIENENLDKSIETMNSTNPLLIPRNWIVEDVLRSAVRDDNLEPLKEFVKHLKSPFKNLEKTSQYQDPGKSFSRNYKTFCGT